MTKSTKQIQSSKFYCHLDTCHFHTNHVTIVLTSSPRAFLLPLYKVHDLLGSSDLLERFGIRCNWSPSKEQVEVLRSAFSVNQYPNRVEKEHLANSLNITLRNVDNWFRARRESIKKSSRWWLIVSCYNGYNSSTSSQISFVGNDFSTFGVLRNCR